MMSSSSWLSPPAQKASAMVGAALLHSLLNHEDVVKNAISKDAALDFLGLLQSGAGASVLLKQYYVLRQHCEPLAYLQVFKIRRWLESQVQVFVDGEAVGPLKIGFRTFKALRARYESDAWEFAEALPASHSVWVSFQWLEA